MNKRLLLQFLVVSAFISTNLYAFSMTSGGKVVFPGHPFVKTQALQNSSQAHVMITNKTFTTVYIGLNGNTQLTAIPAKSNYSAVVPKTYIIYLHNRPHGNALLLKYNENLQAQIYTCKVKNGTAILDVNQAEYILTGDASIYTDSTKPDMFLTIQ